MALVLADRVKETTSTTGTGTLSLLGAVTGFQSFSSGVGNANSCYYTIADQGGANWEVGIGTYTTSGSTLSRDTILASSNSGSAVSFTSGIKDVFVTYPAGKSVYQTSTGAYNTSLKLTKTAPSISSNVLTIDCSQGNFFAVSLNANITSFTVSNIPSSFFEFALELTADGTARTVTWTLQGTAVKWINNSNAAPTLTSTSGKKDLFVFYTYDSGTTWIGAVVGQNA